MCSSMLMSPSVTLSDLVRVLMGGGKWGLKEAKGGGGWQMSFTGSQNHFYGKGGLLCSTTFFACRNSSDAALNTSQSPVQTCFLQAAGSQWVICYEV